jgi:hypothetical protein
MFAGSVSMRGTEDCIALAMVGNHDVLFAAACPDGESPSVVGVELGKWEVRDVELIGRGNLVGLLLGSTLGSLVGGVSGAEDIAHGLEDGRGLGLVEHRPWHVHLRWPLMVASEEGQCFIALRKVRPGKVS